MFLLITAIILLLVVISVLFVKIYIKVTTTWNNSDKCLVGKTAIVTGANRGLGYWTALDLAKRDAKVILACRDKESAEATRKKIVALTSNQNVFIKLLDLASLDSVRKFAQDVNETEEHVHILVNNAGAMSLGNKLTEDGLQLLMQVNHFAVHLLTILLLDKMKASAPSRIVNVSSEMAKYVTVDPKTINSDTRQYSSFLTDMLSYGRTKLCNILFTIELAKRLQDSNVTANCLHPGAVNTEISKKSSILSRILFSPFKFCFKTPEEGAQTGIYLAVSAEVEGVSGCLFSECKQITFYESVKSGKAPELWEETEKLLKLRN